MLQDFCTEVLVLHLSIGLNVRHWWLLELRLLDRVAGADGLGGGLSQHDLVNLLDLVQCSLEVVESLDLGSVGLDSGLPLPGCSLKLVLRDRLADVVAVLARRNMAPAMSISL